MGRMLTGTSAKQHGSTGSTGSTGVDPLERVVLVECCRLSKSLSTGSYYAHVCAAHRRFILLMHYNISKVYKSWVGPLNP